MRISGDALYMVAGCDVVWGDEESEHVNVQVNGAVLNEPASFPPAF